MAEDVFAADAEVYHARLAVERALQKKQVLRQPIARFDPKTGEVYLEHSDGSRTPMGQAMRQGRYSERKAKQ